MASKQPSPQLDCSQWDVTGTYLLKCKSLYRPGNASNYSIDIHYQNGPPGQLFATFAFKNLRGIMRMCCASSFKTDPETGAIQPLSLEEFEAACDLPEGVKPGPASKEWLMRWRGYDGELLTGGETGAQGQFNFIDDAASSKTDFRGCRISFAMVHKGRHVLVEGIKKRNANPMSLQGWALEKEWSSRFNATWETDAESDVESDGSYPVVGGIIRARNKPRSSLGWSPRPSPQIIEERPDWAWDVSGRWEIIEGRPNNTLGLPSTSSMSLTIFHTNHTGQSGLGRQLWAKFEFGLNEGLIRFRPSLLGDHEDCSQNFEETYNVKDFEKACKLEGGDWLGPGSTLEGPGLSKWHIRMRGTSYEDSWFQIGDETETTVTFSKLDDGRLCMNAGVFFQNDLRTFEAIKVAEMAAPGPNEMAIRSRWEGYKHYRNLDLVFTRAWMKLVPMMSL